MSDAALESATQALMGSFLASCDNIDLIKHGASVRAIADCITRTGNIRGTSFSDVCDRDLANCDGTLKCGC